MHLSQLQRATPNKPGDRIGRGGKRGKTSGRGVKGQRAHGSHGIRPEIKDAIRKLPKLRGRGMNMNKQIGKDVRAVNLNTIAQYAEKGTVVNLAWLQQHQIVPKSWIGSDHKVKILGYGDLSVAITVQNIPVSAKARDIITNAGGSVM